MPSISVHLIINSGSTFEDGGKYHSFYGHCLCARTGSFSGRRTFVCSKRILPRAGSAGSHLENQIKRACFEKIRVQTVGAQTRRWGIRHFKLELETCVMGTEQRNPLQGCMVHTIQLPLFCCVCETSQRWASTCLELHVCPCLAFLTSSDVALWFKNKSCARSVQADCLVLVLVLLLAAFSHPNNFTVNAALPQDTRHMHKHIQKLP